MTVITISREFGSGGMDIGRQVAETLNYHFVDKGIIGRVLGQYGLAQFSQEYDSPTSFWDRFDAHRMKERALVGNMLNQALVSFARHGDMVIVGRCGFAVLGGLADVLNVRLQAPLADRIARVMEREKIADFAQAEAAVKEGDKLRSAFIELSYGVPWDSARAFDLVIDTAKLPPSVAVTFILEAVKALPADAMGNARTTRTLVADPILASAVSYELKCEAVHQA